MIAAAMMLLAPECCAAEDNVEGSRRILRLAADPNNLPFSNEQGEGFENKIAELIARELNADLEYVWHAQRRGFFRITMKEKGCDLALGAPMNFERALPTRPYYRSTYLFVTRRDRGLDVKSLDDPRLRSLKIGVQVIGDDATNTPPAHALAARGIVENVIGYSVYGDYRRADPSARIVEAVANGEVDLAIVWGPLAGYHAQRQKVELELRPVTPAEDEKSAMRFTFAIGAGVGKHNPKLVPEVNSILERRQAEIDAILAEYAMPRLPLDEELRRYADASEADDD